MNYAKNIVRILVVDDDVAVREGLKAYLEDYNFEVVAFGSAERTLEHFREGKSPPVVAVVDIRLPGMNGDMLILKLYDRFRSAMRFLVITGSVNFHPNEGLQKIGVLPEHVIRKPLHDIHLIARKIAQLTR